jgi:cytochrome c oxidase assembly protein subunit 15
MTDVLRSPVLLRRVALASIAANVGIVITGGVVRLTDSGMGCPDWPRCDTGSVVATPRLGVHGLIESGNRTLITVVGGLALACVVLALLQRPRRRDQLTWAGLVVAGIVGQAVLGGAIVHSTLDPWIVAAHFLLSMALIAAAYRFWLTTRPAPGGDAPPRIRALAWLITGTSAAVLLVGTVVTGSGPHAGDAQARRTGLDPGTVAQVHADLVMLLIGLSVALVLFAPPGLRRVAGVLVGVELAQGLIGIVQYLTHVPSLLVGLHMAGACAVWLATLAVLAGVQARGTATREPIASASRSAAPVA